MCEPIIEESIIEELILEEPIIKCGENVIDLVVSSGKVRSVALCSYYR